MRQEIIYFLHSIMACELWLLVFTLFGVHWVMPQPQDVMDLFAFWKGGLISQHLLVWEILEVM